MQLHSKQKPNHLPKNRISRHHQRYLFSVPVTVHSLLRSGFKTTRGMSVDISEGGMAAILQAGLRVGETVEIDVALPVDPLHAVAIVRHVTDSRSGFEFLGLTPHERSQIAMAGRGF